MGQGRAVAGLAGGKAQQDDKKKAINIGRQLDRMEKSVRSLLIDEIIRLQRPLAPADIERLNKHFEFSLADVVRRLEEKKVVVQNAGNSLVAAFPVSAVPTRHRVSLADGRDFFAMCAIDSIGAAFAFNQDATVQSSCLDCDTAVTVSLQGGRLREVHPATVHVLHVDLSQYRDWAANC